MNKGGRPTKYSKHLNEIGEKACALYGATDEELAEMFGICRETLYQWKRVHKGFSDSLKKGKDYFDSKKVEAALRDRALGYVCKDTKFATHEGIITDEREYDKHYPPDTTACIFWLKNRQPERWREKPDGQEAEAPQPQKVEIVVKDSRVRDDS